MAAGLSNGILEIAFRQFMNTGYAATSMESIAVEARVSKRTLYDRFPSKVQLFEAALRQQAAFDFQELSRFESHPGPIRTLLPEIGSWLLAHTLQWRQMNLYRLLVAEGHRMPELAQYSEEQVINPMISALSRIFARAIERRELVDLSPEFLAEQFLQAVCGQEIRKRLLGTFHVEDGAAMEMRMRTAVDMFIAGALRQPAAGTPSLCWSRTTLPGWEPSASFAVLPMFAGG